MTEALRIVLAGGSGQIGGLLARHFHACGHEVVVIARSMQQAPWRVTEWDGAMPGDWTRDLERADVLINLAGRSVNCRYTAANRRAIKESRVLSTQLLGRAIARLDHPPRLWMNASTANDLSPRSRPSDGRSHGRDRWEREKLSVHLAL